MFPFLPFVLIGLAAAGAGAGGYKAVRGAKKMRKAKHLVETAEYEHLVAVAEAERARRQVDASATEYEQLARTVHTQVLGRFATFVQTLQRRGGVDPVRLMSSVSLRARPLPSRPSRSGRTRSAALGAARGLVSGVGTGAAAYSAVGALAAASTGTPIASLSGVAATNATLAAIGGGSLASGGLGIAAGTAVLGGLAVAPALLAAGFALNHQGNKALTRAHAYASRVRVDAANLSLARVRLEGIGRRIRELHRIVERLSGMAEQEVGQLVRLRSFDTNNPGHVDRFRRAAMLCKAIAEVLRAEVVNQGGDPSEAGAEIVARYATLTS